ncbi:MAG TPA: hypothetical protein VIZ18_12625 [Ktedonobacteraceae bacterium]
MAAISWGAGVDPGTIPPKIEESLRKELGLTTPISYSVDARDMHKLSKSEFASKFAKDVGKMFVTKFPGEFIGSSALGSLVDVGMEKVAEKKRMFEFELLCSIHFDITRSRRAQLHVDVSRWVKGSSIVNRLLFVSELTRPVGGEVTMERQFIGHLQTCAKLNANKDLLKKTIHFRKSSLSFSNPAVPTLKVEPLFKIVPQGQGSILAIQTLPKTTAFGFGTYIFDAKAFFELVTMLEATL